MTTYTKHYGKRAQPPKTVKKRRITAREAKVVPVVLMVMGVILLVNALWPILSYQLFTSPSLQAAEGQPALSTEPVAVREYLLPTPKPTPVVIAQDLDYTDLSNWFPENSLPLLAPTLLKHYTISIPTVNLFNAEVAVGGTNLDRSLIQYPGTANPGELGAPVIFGHSVLRQFYDPSEKNPRRYISIFSKIMTLALGDKIIVNSDRVTYTYKVITKTEVKPEDTFILEQHHDARELKLVTCVPEGTYLRRGVVIAQLEAVQ